MIKQYPAHDENAPLPADIAPLSPARAGLTVAGSLAAFLVIAMLGWTVTILIDSPRQVDADAVITPAKTLEAEVIGFERIQPWETTAPLLPAGAAPNGEPLELAGDPDPMKLADDAETFELVEDSMPLELAEDANAPQSPMR